MSSNLQKLIAHYEAERNALTAELDVCVTEQDYVTARRFSKALRYVNHRLQTLLNLQDSRYDERERATQFLQMLEERMHSRSTGVSQGFYVDRILDAKKNLARLEAPPVTTPSVSKPTALQEALHKLRDKQIDSFTFVFSQANGLSCVVKLVRRTVMITLPEVLRHRKNYLLNKKQIRSLKTLGFKLYDSGDKLMLFLPYTTADDVKAVQQVLVHLAFETFYFKEFAGQSCIKYWEGS
jgi:hypothetical protein